MGFLSLPMKMRKEILQPTSFRPIFLFPSRKCSISSQLRIVVFYQTCLHIFKSLSLFRREDEREGGRERERERKETGEISRTRPLTNKWLLLVAGHGLHRNKPRACIHALCFFAFSSCIIYPETIRNWENPKNHSVQLAIVVALAMKRGKDAASLLACWSILASSNIILSTESVSLLLGYDICSQLYLA